MPIKIKSFGPLSGGGTYRKPEVFGGTALEDPILYGDLVRSSRKALKIDHGFADLAVRGRFKLGRDDEGPFVKSGVIKSIKVSQPGEGVVQVWSGLNWKIGDIDKAIRRLERGDKFAFEQFLEGFEYQWQVQAGRFGGFAQGSGARDDIRGSNKGDQIWGAHGADVINGRGGSDDVYGGSGDDRMIGGGGEDLLRGEEGADRIFGGKGGDNLQGGGGDDLVRGGVGDDFVRGEWDRSGAAGNDRLYGDGGNDQLSGGGGDDRLWGGAGADQLGGDDTHKARAQTGDDRLWGGGGNDRMEGGGGDDLLFGGAGKDTLDGGAGDDALHGDADVDRMFGGAGADELFGGAGDDVLWGDGGPDSLFGGEGDDQLEGSDGEDVLKGGAGNDSLFGRDGVDVFDFTGDDFGVDQWDFDIARDFTQQGFPIGSTDRIRLDAGATLVVKTVDDPDPEAVFGAERVAVDVMEDGGTRLAGTVLFTFDPFAFGTEAQTLAIIQAELDAAIL